MADQAELIKELHDALSALLKRDMRNTCQHEETHRGGSIWEICSQCGAKWADDTGGRPEWKDPKEWGMAQEALDKAKAFLGESQPDSTATWVREARDSLNDYLRVEDSESDTVMGLALDLVARYPDCHPEFRDSIKKLKQKFVPEAAGLKRRTYEVYYKSPQEMVYTIVTHSEEKARESFLAGHDEEIIRIEEV